MNNTVQLKQREGKALQVILIFLACVGVLAAAYFLTLLGPEKSEGISQKSYAQMLTQLADLDTESNNLWERFSNLKAFKKTLDPEDIKLLEQAATMRETYVRESKNLYDPVMADIRKELHTLKADELRAKSLALDSQAVAAREKLDYPEAEKLFLEAKELETKIGNDFFLSGKKDIARISYLDHQARLMRAKPVWDASLALEKEADALYAKKDWEQAAVKYLAAHEKETLIREKYMGLLTMEYGRAARLLSQSETARATPEYEKIQVMAKEAERLGNEGKLEDSEKKWDSVLVAQDDLSKQYPKSEYAAKEALTRLKNWRDQNLSASSVTLFNENITKLDALIRAGKSDEAGNFALGLYQEGRRLVAKFPTVPTVDGRTLTKLQYIGFKARDMALVQDTFLSLLKPVPGSDGVRMMYAEVSQIFYSALMEGENPSATRGDTLPVDSVTYDEAEEFCRRVSWLTGRDVRLPTEAEFKKAVGEVTAEKIAGQVWSIENSNGRTHPVATAKPNANGFYDLLGNVGEWLLTDAKNPGAPVTGGDCQTGLDEIVQMPVTLVLKKDKSRLRGFRVVVDDSAKK